MAFVHNIRINLQTNELRLSVSRLDSNFVSALFTLDCQLELENKRKLGNIS